MKKAFSIVGLVIVGLVALGASTHAAAGSMPHEGLECLACSLCSFVEMVAQHL